MFGCKDSRAREPLGNADKGLRRPGRGREPVGSNRGSAARTLARSGEVRVLVAPLPARLTNLHVRPATERHLQLHLRTDG